MRSTAGSPSRGSWGRPNERVHESDLGAAVSRRTRREDRIQGGLVHKRRPVRAWIRSPRPTTSTTAFLHVAEEQALAEAARIDAVVAAGESCRRRWPVCRWR